VGPSQIQVRKVEIDFSDAKVHWSVGQPEYSQLFNALSVAVPYLEPYLIKIMRPIKEMVPAENVKLREDIDLFVGQEARHFKLHMQSNRRLREAGYDIGPWEQKAKADYERFLAKGPKFGLAYCEGFETFGPILSGFFFEGAPDLMDHYDEATCYLWVWHLAEEYEHRHVANYTFKALYDDYWYRIYGLWYASIHLFGFLLRLGYQMIKEDRRSGKITGPKWRSNLRLARATGRLLGYIFPRVIFTCHKRGYDPAALPPPGNALRLLEDASQRYGILEPK
jgi:hypothetical protein